MHEVEFYGPRRPLCARIFIRSHGAGVVLWTLYDESAARSCPKTPPTPMCHLRAARITNSWGTTPMLRLWVELSHRRMHREETLAARQRREWPNPFRCSSSLQRMFCGILCRLRWWRSPIQHRRSFANHRMLRGWRGLWANIPSRLLRPSSFHTQVWISER